MFGTSHAVNVLRYASRDSLPFSLEDWSELASVERFFQIRTKPAVFANESLSAFVAVKWDRVSQHHTLPDGRREVTSNQGFINLMDSLTDQQEGNILFSLLHGHEHAMLSLVQHNVPYDFCLPWFEELGFQSGYQVVPYDAIKHQTEASIIGTIASLGVMRNMLPKLKIVHVLPPPPIELYEDATDISKSLRLQILTHGISPFLIRMKYYLLANYLIRNELEKLNIEVIECPTIAKTEMGGLKRTYAYGFLHANEAYGQLVIQQMQALINR